jgi:hypothetical protein
LWRRVALQRGLNHESGGVEIVQREQRQVELAADGVDQLSRRDDAHAFARNDHEVVSVGEVDRLEQRGEALFFAKQDSGDASARADDIDIGAGERGGENLRVPGRAQIVSDFKRAAADSPVGMGLFKAPPRIINDVPNDVVLLNEIGQ